jgi:glycosyltransferase involved in cell wall biosynthesis
MVSVEESVEDVGFEYVMVDDGSQDGTLEALLEFKRANPDNVVVVKLDKNYGSYNAIYAGLQQATGDCIVVISADLQDPPELILEMFNHWKAGANLVLAHRIRRRDSFLQRLMADGFHFGIRIAALPSVPSGGFDYCLFDKRLGKALLDRMVPDINSLFLLLKEEPNPEHVSYERARREIGTSKWTFKKKMDLATNTLIYFSPQFRTFIWLSAGLTGLVCVGLIGPIMSAVDQGHLFQIALSMGSILLMVASIVYLLTRLYNYRINCISKRSPFKVEHVF